MNCWKSLSKREILKITENPKIMVTVRWLLRTVPPNTEVFFAQFECTGKVDLSLDYWNPERKLGVAGHFF